MALGQWLLLLSKKIAILPEMKALHGQKTVFQKTVCAKEERSGPPSADQGFLQLRPEAVMLPGPSVETRPPLPVPPFLPI